MSLLDDAREIAIHDGSDGTGRCAICGTPPDMTFFGGASSPLHTPDCPWLSMPKIVAALEAAERLVTDGNYEATGRGEQLVSQQLFDALVAVLKGGAALRIAGPDDEVTKIFTEREPVYEQMPVLPWRERNHKYTEASGHLPPVVERIGDEGEPA